MTYYKNTILKLLDIEMTTEDIDEFGIYKIPHICLFLTN